MPQTVVPEATLTEAAATEAAATERALPRNAVSSTDEEQSLPALRWAADRAQHAEAPAGPAPGKLLPAQWRSLDVADIRPELDRLLLGKQPDAGLEGLREIGFLDVWLPEVASMVGFGDGEWRHKDVWKHTKQVVLQSVRRIEVRWGALLHDVGKVKTRSVGPRGEIHFFGHSEVGAAMFRKRMARRLAFQGKLHDRVHFLILHHLRASQYEPSWTDSAVRRFDRDMGDGLRDLLDLSRADITTKRPEKKKRGLRQISNLSRRIEALRVADAQVPPLPKGLGNAVTEAFGIPPSKRIGDLFKLLEKRVAEGELEGGKDVDFYITWMTDNREPLDI